MADISATLAQFSTILGEGVTSLFSLLTNLATFFALATGLASLFFGRRMFWIFVATVGFIVGTHIAPLIYPYLPDIMEPFEDLIGMAIALVLAGTAIVMQRFATIIFGALALGIVGYMIAGSADSIEWVQWFFTGLFALAGGLLLYFFFDWTLIIVSVLVGSAIAIFGARTTGGIPDDYGLWLFALLLAAGLIYQGNDLRTTSRLRQSSASKQDGTAKQDGSLPAAAVVAPMTQDAQQPGVPNPLTTPYQGSSYSSKPNTQPTSVPSGANTVMVPLKPKPVPSETVQRAYQPDFAPMTASMTAASAVATTGAFAPTMTQPKQPAPTSTFISPIAPTPAVAPVAAAATVATTGTKRVELFPGYPAASFSTPVAQSAPVLPSIYSPEYENVAPAFPPTFASSGYTQSKQQAKQQAAAPAPVASKALSPETMAPSLNTQSSMSFSDLWKWTPWRKSEESGTVNSANGKTAASQSAPNQAASGQTAQANSEPYRSSPEALG